MDHRLAYTEVELRFTHHPPVDAGDVAAHEALRAEVKQLAQRWVDALPEGRERAMAFTNLEQALFWANAALARARA